MPLRSMRRGSVRRLASSCGARAARIPRGGARAARGCWRKSLRLLRSHFRHDGPPRHAGPGGEGRSNEQGGVCECGSQERGVRCPRSLALVALQRGAQAARRPLGDGLRHAGLQMSDRHISMPKGLQVQVMDRDGPHGPVCVINDTTVSDNPCAVWSSCDPLKIAAKTRVTHPQSADEALRNGYLRHAPGNINGDFSSFSTCQCLLGVPTWCVGAILLSCCWSPGPS